MMSGHNIKKLAVQGEKLHQQVVYHHSMHTWKLWKQKWSFCVFYTGHDRPWGRLEAAKKKTSFCILVRIWCHNILACTPQSGYQRGAKVTKTADIAKMAEKCTNCIRARPTAPHTNPLGSGHENTISAQN